MVRYTLGQEEEENPSLNRNENQRDSPFPIVYDDLSCIPIESKSTLHVHQEDKN